MSGKKTDYVICTRNTGYEASLEVRKLYQLLPDPDARSKGLLRILDESGEDYLYPESYFVHAHLPKSVADHISRVA